MWDLTGVTLSWEPGHSFPLSSALYLRLTDTHLHQHTRTGTQSQSTVHRDLQAYRLCDSRSTLHSDGADVVHAAVIDVAALGGELHTLALEVLLLKQSHLHTERGGDKTGGGMRMCNVSMCVCMCICLCVS